MKKVVPDYIAKCLEFQQVKFEHKHPIGLLQPLKISKWKWETLSMDFITSLSKTIKQHDAIIVVVDKLSNATHFIPIKSTFKAIDVVDVFVKDIFKLHGMPETIISYRDVKFTSNFCKILFVGLEMQLGFNISYHPQTHGQAKRVNTVLEDMLMMYVTHQPKCNTPDSLIPFLWVGHQDFIFLLHQILLLCLYCISAHQELSNHGHHCSYLSSRLEYMIW
jgi:hypothetical protein